MMARVRALMDQGESAVLRIGVLGDLSIFWKGKNVPLPASRKTRALLAYLAVTGRPQRRERLCELFWEVPDDPKGALRWSLSKLRSSLGEACKDVLDANRNTVHLVPDKFLLDCADLANAKTKGFDQIPTEQLQTLAKTLRGGFLEDLSMANCPGFEAWRVARADEFGQMAIWLLRTLVTRLSSEPERARPYATALRLLETDGAHQDAGELLAPRSTEAAPEKTATPAIKASADVRYCLGLDGTRLAYSVGGSGPPLVRAPHWMSHVQFDSETPIWRHWIDGLHQHFTYLRYDERGNGLSDWSTKDLSFEAMVSDLEIVVDAAGFDSFNLLGISQGAAIAIAYAVRNPGRVRNLILYGGFAKGARYSRNAHELALCDALETLVRTGWGSENPILRNMFVLRFVPKATAGQMAAFAELQRKTMSPENALKMLQMSDTIDVSALLAAINIPTLAIHGNDDRVVPFEAGKAMAARIAGARFVPLDSENHILSEGEPAFDELIDLLVSSCSD